MVHNNMKKIRKSVFETNSSSTHSICIAKCDEELTIPKSLHFEFGEFGWQYSTLQSINEKASYLYTGFISEGREDDAFLKIFEVLRSKGIEVTAEKPIYEMYIYTNHRGELVEVKLNQNGYIEDSGELNDFLNDICKDENKLMNYLFSDLSFIITGNDNHKEEAVDIDVDYPHYRYDKGN